MDFRCELIEDNNVQRLALGVNKNKKPIEMQNSISLCSKKQNIRIRNNHQSRI